MMNTLIAPIIYTSVACYVLLSIAHWFPYHKVTRTPLTPVQCYIIGTVCMLTPVFLWTLISHFVFNTDFTAFQLIIPLVFHLYFSSI